jgi:hypothetical protein
MKNLLKLTWKLPVIAFLGLVLMVFASSCGKPFTANDFKGLHYPGDTVHLKYEEAVPGKETRTWCSGNTWTKDICTSRSVDTTFVIQGKAVDAKSAADGWNARVHGYPINWSKYFGWVPAVLAVLLGFLLLGMGLALLGVVRDAWNRFWQTRTSPATAHQPPAQAPQAQDQTVPTGTIPGNDQYFFSVPKGTRVEAQMGNGTGFVNNGERPPTAPAH